MVWHIKASPSLVSHRWSTKTRLSAGKSLRSLFLSRALMLTRPTMYSLLLGNVEGKFCLRGKHSGTNCHTCSSIEIHILNLLDGTPYCAPPSNVIHWATSPDPPVQSANNLIITSSRLMLHARSPRDDHISDPPWWISVWDWKTGDIVIVMWLRWTCFAHFISGTQPFTCALRRPRILPVRCQSRLPR